MPKHLTDVDDNVFADMVNLLMKPGEAILATLTPERCDLWHAGTGAAGEAGELLDAIKKHVAYNRDIDRENVIEELGDLEFYMQAIRRNLGISRTETLTATYNKLMGKRYPNGYSDAAAAARADKVGG